MAKRRAPIEVKFEKKAASIDVTDTRRVSLSFPTATEFRDSCAYGTRYERPTIDDLHDFAAAAFAAGFKADSKVYTDTRNEYRSTAPGGYVEEPVGFYVIRTEKV